MRDLYVLWIWLYIPVSNGLLSDVIATSNHHEEESKEKGAYAPSHDGSGIASSWADNFSNHETDYNDNPVIKDIRQADHDNTDEDIRGLEQADAIQTRLELASAVGKLGPKKDFQLTCLLKIFTMVYFDCCKLSWNDVKWFFYDLYEPYDSQSFVCL